MGGPRIGQMAIILRAKILGEIVNLQQHRIALFREQAKAPGSDAFLPRLWLCTCKTVWFGAKPNADKCARSCLASCSDSSTGCESYCSRGTVPRITSIVEKLGCQICPANLALDRRKYCHPHMIVAATNAIECAELVGNDLRHATMVQMVMQDDDVHDSYQGLGAGRNFCRYSGMSIIGGRSTSSIVCSTWS